jgi:excinuclease ABC subunit C
MKKESLKIKIKKLPKSPGVYLMKNAEGEIIYVGKAASLRNRVASYFNRPHDFRIEKMVGEISDIDFRKTSTVIEALILEANLIKKYQPRYNVKEKDDKSFLYVAFSEETYARLMLLRGQEIEKNQKSKIKNQKYISKIKKIFGPYTSAASIRAALDILRKIFPFRDCPTFPKRPCLQYHLKRCGAPCVGLVGKTDYRKNIKNLILFFEGKKEKIIKNLKKEMAMASGQENFEKAARLRNQIFFLEHIQDVAILTANSEQLAINIKEKGINIFGRIEGYDISNISGTSATGSMVVFENGKPNKNEYRKFKIKTISTSNDVAMLREVLSRRLRRIKSHESEIRKLKNHNSCFIIHNSKIWPLPDVILIDGGWGQINAVQEILAEHKIRIPIVGIAKGFDRKQDRLIYDKNNLELGRVAEEYKNILLQARDEAHRFAQNYHKFLRKKKFFR